MKVLPSVTTWVAGSAAAVGAGVLALFLIGSRVPDPAPVAAGTASALPSPVPLPVTSRPAPPRRASPASPKASFAPASFTSASFTSAGGTVDAACGAGGAYLLSWSPAAGYRIAGLDRGPAPQAEVRFAGDGRGVTVSVSCAAGQPRATVRLTGDD